MKIALVSLNQVWENKSENKILCYDFVSKAKSLDCELIIFPEMTLTGFKMAGAAENAEEVSNSETINYFRDLCIKNNISIAFGMIAKGDTHPENKMIFIDNEGKVLGNYTKIHPFSLANEDQYFNPGNNIVNLQLCGVNIGLSICYDLRFPELYQILSKKSEIIINIANWPKKRVQHWRALLKARAIENQVFMVGVNRTGIDGNQLAYEESSTIINPNGDVEPYLIQQDVMRVFDIDLNEVAQSRNAIAIKADRRVDFYKKLL
jgi:omega-amidase